MLQKTRYKSLNRILPKNTIKKINIEVKYAEKISEMFEAIEKKEVDIISPAHSYAKSEKYQFIQKGIILPIEVKNIPNFNYLIPALKVADYTTHQWKLYAIPIAHGPYGLIYNKKYFDIPPDSWTILWDKKYGQKYSISIDQYEANIYITALSMGLFCSRLYKFKEI